ncbi:hypothetical protein B0H14DRAFT_3860527 [Mycena olivaceomarginata]|nr:hypothetical protein B0H14DRAFT_3860527 [Mycena olivaceomarginata]
MWPHALQEVVCSKDKLTDKVLGKNLTFSQALAHAAHHIVTESYLAEEVAKDEAELEAIDQQLDADPDSIAFEIMRIPDWYAVWAVEWSLGCRLDVALKDVHIPNLRSRGVSAITPIQLDSLVIMRSAVRLYLGEVVGIYRYGSVSGRHESFVTAETVDGLSYLSLRVYEQLHPGYNMFQHIVPPERPRRDALALFTHAPVSELIYLLSGAKVSKKGEVHCLSAGEVGWERWEALRSTAVYRLLGIENSADNSEEEEEDEEDYEEPEGTSSKKRKPKPPRGASKKQREAAAEKQKVQRKKKKTAGGNRTVRATAMAARGRKEKK